VIENLVVWGGNEGGHDSLRWINKAFYETGRKVCRSSKWVPDAPESVATVQPGCVVIAEDRWDQFIPFVPGVDYVVHNFRQDHPVMVNADPRNLLRLQVWTDDAFGEEWAPCRKYSAEGRVLFQPWGADLLAEEFCDPVFNPLSREAVFVGAIWSDWNAAGEDMGNTDAIADLVAVLREHGLTFRHLTQVSERENIEAVRGARLAPAITGRWQREHNYLPCRVFKNVAYGTVAFTNVPAFKGLFKDSWVKGETVGQLVQNALLLKRGEYEDLVRAQQRVVANYTYRESLEAIGRALEAGK
jgi:hypothetical protein